MAQSFGTAAVTCWPAMATRTRTFIRPTHSYTKSKSIHSKRTRVCDQCVKTMTAPGQVRLVIGRAGYREGAGGAAVAGSAEGRLALGKAGGRGG